MTLGVMKFPWAQIILKLNGFVLQVKFVIYSIIERKDKFLPSKLGTLQKHACCCRQLLPQLMLVLGSGFTIRIQPITKMK